MKNARKLISLLLCAAVCLSMMLVFTSCSGEKTYKVTLKDAFGTPMTSGVVVQFIKGNKQVAMQTCDENGVATKTLDSGRYNVALKFADEETEYYYDSDIKLTSSKNEVEIIIAKKLNSEPTTVVAGDEEFQAYSVDAGCTYAELDTERRNYFLFEPKQAGTYEFSIVEGDGAIGYYGAPHFIQSNSALEVKDNKFSISISASMISTYVIGVDANESDNCVIGINRTGDPQKTLEDEPWNVYEATVELKNYTLPASAELKEFDLTASTDTYNLVFNEQDGFYHLNSANGPLVLVRLAEDCQYIDCFQTILDRSGVTRYFFDENGDFVKKESYSECLLEYIEYVDEDEGVYPLTKDLEYIIKQRGEYSQWWKSDSQNYLFKDNDGNNVPGINSEIAWLLMCCYIG